MTQQRRPKKVLFIFLFVAEARSCACSPKNYWFKWVFLLSRQTGFQLYRCWWSAKREKALGSSDRESPCRRVLRISDWFQFACSWCPKENTDGRSTGNLGGALRLLWVFPSFLCFDAQQNRLVQKENCSSFSFSSPLYSSFHVLFCRTTFRIMLALTSMSKQQHSFLQRNSRQGCLRRRKIDSNASSRVRSVQHLDSVFLLTVDTEQIDKIFCAIREISFHTSALKSL